MKITYNNNYHDVYTCPCGKSKSYKSEMSGASGDQGAFLMAFNYFNVRKKIDYCSSCKSYWLDGNARYFHELPLILKILYAMGWVVLPYFIPFWKVFLPSWYDEEYALLIIFSPVLFVFGFLLQVWFIVFALFCNIISFPFVIVPHIKEIINSKKYEEEEYWQIEAFKEAKYKDFLSSRDYRSNPWRY